MKERFQQLIRYRELKHWYETYERFLLPGTLVVGVIVDAITFTSINIRTTFLLLFVYLVITGGMIAFVHIYDARERTGGSVSTYLRLAGPLVIQFFFGALLSGSFVFYWFSGAFSVSWPLILLLALLMISNDVFRHYYVRPIVQISVYFFILFSLSSLFLPFLFNSLSIWLFVASGIVSLVLIYLYLRFLFRFAPTIREQRIRFMVCIGAVYVFLNALYFLNIIPPIPLVLREGGAYDNVERSGNDYWLIVEKESWFSRIVPGHTIHIKEGSPVFVFTAIFAPADLNTKIVHHWQRYDEKQKKWVTTDRLSFSITGGRSAGYRGFSRKSNVAAGKWRVDVETERGQVLGRVSFRVKYVGETPETEIVVE